MRDFIKKGVVKLKHQYQDDIYVASLINFSSIIERNFTVYIEVEEDEETIEILGVKVFHNDSEEISLTDLEEEELINKIAEIF